MIMVFVDKGAADVTALRVTFSPRVTVTTTQEYKPRRPPAGQFPARGSAAFDFWLRPGRSLKPAGANLRCR